MPNVGYLIVKAFTAKGAVPLANVSVLVTSEKGSASKVIAFRTTNSDGITPRIEIPTPDVDLSLHPSKQVSFTSVDIQLSLTDYEDVLITGVQIFPTVESIQPVEMIPLGETPSEYYQKYSITPQNL